MGDHGSRSEVVVGLDGSAGSRAALEWAARAFGDKNLHAVQVADPGDEPSGGDAPEDIPTMADGIRVSFRTGEGDAADVLRRVAEEEDADLIVIGAHGHRSFDPRRLGRVTSELLRDARRPVAIVGDAPLRTTEGGNTVVAGVGQGPATRAALEWAIRFAAGHRTSLSLVHALVHRPLFRDDGILDVMAYYLDPSKLTDWALEDLTELADDIRRSTESDVAVTISAPAGRPGPRLVEAGADAAVLVIGRHHDGDLATHLIPPTLRHVLTHAPCPVVVVPAPGPAT